MWVKYLFISCAIAFSFFYFKNLNVPLAGAHKIRQADTLFTAYSYCEEGSSFFYPRTVFRQDTTGIAIGEFPLTSYLFSAPCKALSFWAEWQPNLIVFLLFLLNCLVWGVFLKRQAPAKWPGWLAFLTLFSFSTHALSYFLIPLPDLTSVLFAGLAGLVYQKSNRSNYFFYALSVALFAVAFLIRPYNIVILAVLLPFDWSSFKRSFYLALPFCLVCVLAYIFWFKIWSQQSEVARYTLNFKMSDLLSQYNLILVATLKKVVTDIFNYIGVVAFFFFLKKNKTDRLFLVNLFLAVLLMWLATTYAVIHHGYYLTGVWLLLIAFVVQNLQALPKKFKAVFLSVWLLIGVTSVAHRFNVKKFEIEANEMAEIKSQFNLKPFEKIAIYQPHDNPVPFYRLKAVGYSIPLSEFKGPAGCPSNANFYLNAETKEFGKCTKN